MCIMAQYPDKWTAESLLWAEVYFAEMVAWAYVGGVLSLWAIYLGETINSYYA